MEPAGPNPWQQLPKVELHLHLDCSLSFEVVQKLRPGTTYAQWQADFVAPPKCTDLADYISRAIKGFELMQTPEQLRLVTLDLMQQLQADGVIYAELRFAPLQHVYQGMMPAQVVQAVHEAVAEGIAKTGVQANIILCTLRHYSHQQSMETVHLVKDFSGTHVVGFDIAADEAGYPIDAHKEAFDFAHAHGLPCTAHAGEARGADSVWETLQYLKPSRIGHGVRSAEDPALLQHLCRHGIHLEVCPTSNIQTNVFDTLEQHTAQVIYDAGVSMSINTDARTISPVTLCSEYQLMCTHFGWTARELWRCNQQAIAACFAPTQLKDALMRQLDDAWKQVALD